MPLTSRLALLYKANPLNLKLLKRFILAFLSVIVIAFIGFVILHPDLKPMFHNLDTAFSSKPFETSKFGNFGNIALNNCVKIPLQSLLMALIPIPFLYFLYYAATGFTIGFMYYLPLVFKKITFSIVFAGTIVHGIPEVIGLCIICVALFPINKAICQKVFRKYIEDKKTCILKPLCYLLARSI